jgi:hypothetical protein
MLYQVIEKDDIGTDWAPVRYSDRRTLTRFPNIEDAQKAAIDYVTDRNCNNALAPSEKAHALEVFMLTEQGVFLGVLDGKDWYMKHPKNGPKHQKGDIVNDLSYFELNGLTQVKVRPIPGT